MGSDATLVYPLAICLLTSFNPSTVVEQLADTGTPVRLYLAPGTRVHLGRSPLFGETRLQ